MLLNNELLDKITAEAKESPRLRMNYNLHDSLEAKAQRLFNAMEPGTILPIHRHPNTSETYLVVRGRLKVMFYNDNKEITEQHEVDPLKGVYGVHIPKNQWHSLEVLESGTVIFEVKDGPYAPLAKEDIL